MAHPQIMTHLQQGIHNFCVQPVPQSHHPHHKKCLPRVQFKSTIFQFKTVSLYPVIKGTAEQPQFSQQFFIEEVKTVSGESVLSCMLSLIHVSIFQCMRISPQISSQFLLAFVSEEMLFHVNVSSEIAFFFKCGTSSCLKSVSGFLSAVLLWL